MEAFRYVQRSEHEIFNQFDAQTQTAIVPDRFFFDLGGARSQVSVDPQRQTPINNYVINGNNVDQDELYAGPSFTVPTGGNSVLSGELRRSKFRFENPVAGGLDDYDYDTARVGADNYRKRMGATWAARYSAERADYKLAGIPYEHRQATLELGFWANDVFRLFVNGGKETPWDDPLVTSLEDSFWEAGFARSSDQFRAEFAFGERTFGSSRRGDLAYTFDRGSTTFTYSETPATTSAERFRFGGLLDPTEDLNYFNYLYRPGALERYILNRAQWDFDLDLTRFAFAVDLFDEVRTDRTDLLGTELPDQLQKGGNVSATWKVGPKLSVVVSAQTVDREFTDTLASDLSVRAVTGNYVLGSRTRLTFQLQRFEEGAPEEFGGTSYEANVLTATVARTFR
jgi:hypothetical protein